MKLFKRGEKERGAAMVETALVFGLLLMIALGAFEYGQAFQSWFGVSASSREGARVGASVGPTVNADCRILESVAAALKSTSGDDVLRVDIFDHEPGPPATDGATNSYRPFISGTDNPINLRCTSWFLISGGWSETSRDNDGANRDWLGVEVQFRHNWITGFLWWDGSVDWSNRSVMRLEPVSYGG